MITKLFKNKIIITTFLLFFILTSSATLIFAEPLTTTTGSSITINNTTLNFNKIIFVDVNGDDETADGTEENPFRNVDTAIKKSTSGDCIYIKAGNYKLRPIYSDSYTGVGISDEGKDLSFIGEGKDTILEYYGKDSTSRDGNLFKLKNSDSKVINMSFIFYPGKNDNFSNAIFCRSVGSFHNLYIESKGSYACSYSYFNGGEYKTPLVSNCVFNMKNSPLRDYSGRPNFENCISTHEFSSVKTTSLIKKINYEELDMLKTDIETLNKGTGTNPDGTQANIGVYGGEFAWGSSRKISTNKIVLDVEPEKDKIYVAEEVNADLVIDNIKEIAAEDIIIKYDSEKLEYLNYEEVDGIKLVHKDPHIGELRFILASKGEKNIVNGKKVLLKLHFKGIKQGEALVDITRCRVSDGIEMEANLEDKQCDEATIIIEGLEDVNRSGAFTLLDLAIDARHLNKDPKSADLQKYNTDIVVNNAIDEMDLSEIVRLLLDNADYELNNN